MTFCLAVRRILVRVMSCMRGIQNIHYNLILR